MSADEYRRRAADCLALYSQLPEDQPARAGLLDMARAWHQLADQAERNMRTDLVYETPSRAAAPQAVQQQQQQAQPDKRK